MLQRELGNLEKEPFVPGDPASTFHIDAVRRKKLQELDEVDREIQQFQVRHKMLYRELRQLQKEPAPMIPNEPVQELNMPESGENDQEQSMSPALTSREQPSPGQVASLQEGNFSLVLFQLNN